MTRSVSAHASTLLLALLWLSPAATADDQYRVRFSEALDTVEVEACFDGQPPARLQRHREASRFTEWFKLGETASKPGGSRVSLTELPAGACASWRVDLQEAAAAGDYRIAFRVDDVLLTAGNLWFWRDREQRAIEVSVELPAGVQFSTPWRQSGIAAGQLRYRPAKTPASWSSRIAVGHFATQRIPVGGEELRLAMLGDFNEQRQNDVAAWVSEAALGVAAVAGRFPQVEPQVLVVGIGPRSGPVPWAHVIRGGGVAIEFFVDETRPLADFRQDWTPTHEFAHLLLPYVGSQDRWLSEGLASYYQNVLRARDGRLTEQQAWEKLQGGLKRGQDAAGRGTMDTYWRGASVLLQADAELRATTGGEQSLDTLLGELHECCYDPGRRWLAWEIFEQFDRISGTSLFGDLYGRHAYDREFPDAGPVLQKLGVENFGSSTRLDHAAPWSRIRHFIMAPKGSNAAHNNGSIGQP